MSSAEYRKVAIKANGQEDLVGKAKTVIEKLAARNDDMELKMDGEGVSLSELLDVEKFDSVEFCFEYYSSGDYAEYSELMEEVGSRGVGFGAIECFDGDYNTYIECKGDVTSRKVNLEDCEVEWCTGVMLSIVIRLDPEKLCELLGCEPEDLDDALMDDGESPLLGVLGDDLTDTIVVGDVDVMDSDPDEGKIVYSPANGWCFGTIEEFSERKAIFEEAASVMEKTGGSIALYWADEAGNESGDNSFVSEDGFMSLKFETGPNMWGDFEAWGYSL